MLGLHLPPQEIELFFNALNMMGLGGLLLALSLAGGPLVPLLTRAMLNPAQLLLSFARAHHSFYCGGLYPVKLAGCLF